MTNPPGRKTAAASSSLRRRPILPRDGRKTGRRGLTTAPRITLALAKKNDMKLLRLTHLITFGLLLAVAATGCKSSKPKTLLQGSSTTGGIENTNLPPGEKLPGSTE